MKKQIHILLLIMFGFSISGMTLHFNYCCGELSSVEIQPSEKCNEMMGDIACCSEFELQASVDDATNFKPVELLKFVSVFVLPSEYLFVRPEEIRYEETYSYARDESPHQKPLYLLNRVWLI